jgi:hypothetical protein
MIDDGTTMVMTGGSVWRVHAPPRWRLDRWLSWHVRVAAAWVLSRARVWIPVWAQVVVVDTTDGQRLRMVRDVDAFVTWVPDGTEGLQ